MLGCQNTALAILYTNDYAISMPFLQNSQKVKKVYKKRENRGNTIVEKVKCCVFPPNTDVFAVAYNNSGTLTKRKKRKNKKNFAKSFEACDGAFVYI